MSSAASARAEAGQGVFGRAGPLVLARLVSAVLTVSIPLVLARQLEAADYGTYKQLFLVAQTLAMLLPFGVAQSLYFFLPREPGHARSYLGQTLAWLTFVSLLAGMAWAALAPDVARGFRNPAIVGYRLELALVTGGLVVGNVLEVWFTARGHARTSAVSYLVSDSLRAAALVLPVWAGFGLHGAMVACAAFGILRALAAWGAWARSDEGPGFRLGSLAVHARYAAPFGAAMALGVPQSAVHQYAVSVTAPPELFAVYAVGVFQVPLVDLFYTPTSELLMVRLGELEREGRAHDGAEVFRAATARLAYLFFPMVAFLLAVAPLFVSALFGPRYAAATPIFRTSVLGVALAVFPLDGALRARACTRFLFASYLGKALVTVPLVAGGVKLFGMQGAICAWLAVEVLGKASLLWRLPSALGTGETRCPLRRLVPLPDLGRAAAAAVSASTVAALFVRGAPGTHGIGSLAAAGLLFSAAYATALRLQGIRPASLLRA
ncbi:MAG: hypothetical protein RL653_370 [Pseudomonadota bacterium]|jgi:O-antigen/teichoic acid export membrane protein